jgi:hypothetical protein
LLISESLLNQITKKEKRKTQKKQKKQKKQKNKKWEPKKTKKTKKTTFGLLWTLKHKISDFQSSPKLTSCFPLRCSSSFPSAVPFLIFYMLKEEVQFNT